MTDKKLIEAANYVVMNEGFDYLSRFGENGEFIPDHDFVEQSKIIAQSILDNANKDKDDEEKVTEEWLKSVGMDSQWYETSWGQDRLTEIGNAASFSVDVPGGGVLLYFWGTTFACPVECETRGDVRRLAKALGIPLKKKESE